MKTGAVFLLLLFLPGLAVAAGPLTPDDGRPSTLDFSLQLSNNKFPLEYAGRVQDGTSRWLGITLREKASDRVTLGMYGGNAWLSQTGNPLTEGLELDGFHAGLTLHAILLQSQRASLYGVLDYTYQKVDHKSDTQTIVIDWAQSQMQLGVTLRLTPIWRLYGGGSYGKIDGEERASGTVNHTLSFERGARPGGFVGLDLSVEPDGYVGIEARSGLVRSGEIYFKHRF